MSNEAYKLSDEAKKLQEKNPDLFTILQVGEAESEQVQQQLQEFLQQEKLQVSPEVLVGELKRLAYQAPPRG